jgi:hypothetical protein
MRVIASMVCPLSCLTFLNYEILPIFPALVVFEHLEEDGHNRANLWDELEFASFGSGSNDAHSILFDQRDCVLEELH